MLITAGFDGHVLCWRAADIAEAAVAPAGANVARAGGRATRSTHPLYSFKIGAVPIRSLAAMNSIASPGVVDAGHICLYVYLFDTSCRFILRGCVSGLCFRVVFFVVFQGFLLSALFGSGGYHVVEWYCYRFTLPFGLLFFPATTPATQKSSRLLCLTTFPCLRSRCCF